MCKKLLSKTILSLNIFLMLFFSLLGGCSYWDAFLGEEQSAESAESKKPLENSVASPLDSLGEPYQKEGLWHIPAEQPDYDVIGKATLLKISKEEAGSEIVLAGHPTLPLPSLVEVTNMNNGYSMLLMVNQRGAYALGQVVALSAKAARMLKIPEGQWEDSLVRVRYLQKLFPDSSAFLSSVNKRSVDKLDAIIAPLSYFPEILEDAARKALDPQLLREAFSSPQYYIQSGDFSVQRQAQRSLEDLKSVPQSHIVQKQGRYFVRVGPFSDLKNLAAIAEQVRRRGYKKLVIIKKNHLDAETFLDILLQQ